MLKNQYIVHQNVRYVPVRELMTVCRYCVRSGGIYGPLQPQNCYREEILYRAPALPYESYTFMPRPGYNFALRM